MRARGFEVGAAAGLGIADQHRGGAVDDAGGISGVMHVVDRLDVRMRLHRDGVEARELAHLDERRLELRQRLHGGRRPHVLVLGEQRDAVAVLHRDDGFRKAPFVPGDAGALLALHRIGVDVVAGEAVLGGDEVGGNALRHEVGGDRDRRIDRPCPARCADADPAHRFDAAADRHVVLARHHLGRSEIHRVEPGRAEAVDLHARHAVAVAGAQRGGAGDVAARLADRIDAAEHDVVDERGIELVACAQARQRLGREGERGHLMECAVRLAAPARGADVIIDEGVGHEALRVSAITAIPERIRVGCGNC